MFSPSKVTAVDKATGRIVAVRYPSDSHERMDAEAELRKTFPDAEIKSEPR